MAKILFKNGKIQFDSNGKILFTQAGDDPDDCACCGDCTASETSCTNCTDVTPAEYQVTFSGVSLCTGCISAGLSSSYQYAWNGTDNSEINTTHTLTQDAACTWQKTIANTITESTYSSSDCSGTPTTKNLDIRIVAQKTNGTTWRVYIALDGTGQGTAGLFTDTDTVADGNCADGGSFTNSATSCSDNISTEGNSTRARGQGGTATLVCL